MLKEREEFYVNLIKSSNSLIEVCRKANIVPTTGNYDTLKKVIKENEVDISHFKRLGGVSNSGIKKNTSEYLIKGSKITSFKLKNKLLKEGYKEHKCENPECGLTEWHGKPIPLELHHINGDNTDNRLENLQILCPNCHSLTDTYGGKNQKINATKRYCKTCGKELTSGQKVYCSNECRYSNKKETKVKKDKLNINAEILINDFKELKSFRGVGLKYQVSDNGIRRYCKKIGVYDKIRQYITPRKK